MERSENCYEKSWNWVYTWKVLELSFWLEKHFTLVCSILFFIHVSCIVERNTGVMLIIIIRWNSLTTTVRTPLWIVLIGRSLDLMIEMDSNQHYGLAVKVLLQYNFLLYDLSLTESRFCMCIHKEGTVSYTHLTLPTIYSV